MTALARVTSRIAGALGRVLLVLVVSVSLIVASVFLNLDTPVVRRVVIAEVNALVFKSLFKGTFVIDGLGHVDPFGVSGASVRISDPTGRPVIIAGGIQSRFGTLTLLRSLVFGHGDVVIDIPSVTIAYADVRLDMDESGVAIANAFLPRAPSTDEKPTDATPAQTGGGVRLYAPHIHIEHAWGHGLMTGLPYLDGEVSALDAAFALSPTELSVDARNGHVLARGIALGADAEGAFHGHFGMTLADPAEMGGGFAWDGAAGALHEVATMTIEKGRLDAQVDVPDASPEAIRTFWPASPITSTGTAHVEAHGPLEAIDLVARARVDAATVDVRGELAWRPVKSAKIHLEADQIDLHQLASSAPPSSLGAKGDVSATLDEGGRLDGQADLTFPGGHIGTTRVPPVTLHSTGFRLKTGALGGDATVAIEEPGAPTTVTLHAVPRGQSASIDFNILSHAVRLGALRRLTTDATGNVHVSGTGTVNLETLSLEVGLSTHADSLQHGPFRVGSLTLDGHAHGSLLNPRVDLALHARNLAWTTTMLTVLDASIYGPALSPHVTIHERSNDVPDVDAAIDVDLHDGVSFRHADASLAHDNAVAHVLADHARLSPGSVAVDGISIEGLGEPLTGSFALAGSALRIHAATERLDLARIAKLLRLQDTVRGGVLALDVDASIGPAGGDGRARIKVDHAIIGVLDEVSGEVDGRLTGRHFVGAARADAGAIGSIDLQAKDLVLGGKGVLSKASWRSAWGDVALTGRVDLAKLSEHLPAGLLPVSAMRGTVDIHGRLERDNGHDFTPLVAMSATTSNLFIRGKSANADPKDPSHPAAPPWTVSGVDTSVDVRVNGESGLLELTEHFKDAKGDLAVLEAKSTAIPYQAIYEAPSQALALLPNVAFDAHVSFPSRSLATWPAWMGPPPIDGDLLAEVTVHGPVSAPHVDVTAHLAQASSAFARLTVPVELDLHGAYDGAKADVTLHAAEHSHDLLDADAHVVVHASDLLARKGDAPWQASGKVHVDQFPLATIGPLDDRQIRGRLSGDVEVDDLHKDAKATASLSVTSLKIGDAAYPSAKATLRADGKNIDAEVRLDQTDGFGAAKATLPAAWGAALLPSADASHLLGLSLQAKHFRASALMPFVQGSVDELDGFVDADVQATVDPGAGGVSAYGSAALSDGLFELAAFGGELHDISAKLTLTKDGLLTLKDMTASGVSGVVLASASARMKGLHVESASATVTIPKSRPLPLSVGGSQLGMIDGKFGVTESMAPGKKAVDVHVDIPTLHLVLPEAGAQDVQVLGKIPGVTLGKRGGSDGQFVPDIADIDVETDAAVALRKQGAMEVRVLTKLGDDVVIRRGTDVRVELSGDPTVTITDKAHVTGQLRLHGGVLNLYGKTFQIEQGTVTFVGADSANPQVSVTAGWTAADGTQVYADFIGPLKTGKVTLRSEPPLSRNDIVQLLLFGTTDGQAAAAQGAPGTSSAEGVAGNIATQPLNRALSQFGLSAVSAKVDTSSVNAKPEVEVQIAKSISVAVAQIIGQAPVGSNPDTTFLTIDWRFLRKWSLAATVGNADSTIVDLLWQYRY